MLGSDDGGEPRMENHEEIVYIKIEEGEEEVEKNNEIINRVREEFKQFDIIHTSDDGNTNNSSVYDHHFYASSLSDTQTKLYSSETIKRIMEEWRILEESLPLDSIYVRAYDGRIDLLRAVIVGASGTSYHDGLFFFDIQFPFDYPNQPPKVYYHSFGFQLNPNLFPKRGTVCLSLLNTCPGQKNERWNPSESTILQVLLSIQALVLNAKPYFNCSTNLLTGDYSKESLAYNQEVFVLSCKTMLGLLNRPPKHFEEFVSQHFRDRAETILTACKAYIDGLVKVGDHPNTGSMAVEDVSKKLNPVSKKFQDSMGITYSKLVQAFTENGSSLESYKKDNMDADHSKDGKSELILLFGFEFLYYFLFALPYLLSYFYN